MSDLARIRAKYKFIPGVALDRRPDPPDRALGRRFTNPMQGTRRPAHRSGYRLDYRDDRRGEDRRYRRLRERAPTKGTKVVERTATAREKWSDLGAASLKRRSLG